MFEYLENFRDNDEDSCTTEARSSCKACCYNFRPLGATMLRSGFKFQKHASRNNNITAQHANKSTLLSGSNGREKKIFFARGNMEKNWHE